MAIRVITSYLVNGMSYNHMVKYTTEDHADRVSLTAFFAALKTTPDYFPEEKAVFGLGRIGMKFRHNLQGQIEYHAPAKQSPGIDSLSFCRENGEFAPPSY